jgi:SAM-dependent methyltransferase
MGISDFYDSYVARQEAAGINDRHRAILAGLRRFGWKPTDRVLEIGCGIGTLTRLIAKNVLSGGTVVGVDVSPKSIELARQHLSAFRGVELIAADILKLELQGKFDVVVLPDVIEHIPLSDHQRLFERISSWLTLDGFVLLNYPNPHYLAWCHEHTPEVLQLVDQPIGADVLLANAYPSGLYLDYFETYSIWVREGDYVLAVFRNQSAARTFTAFPEPRESVSARGLGHLRSLLRRRGQ